MKIANSKFNRQGYYTEPTLDVDILRDPKCVDLFTKNDSSLQILYLELSRINGKLWDLENEVRDIKTKNKQFIAASKKIFRFNEVRNDIKNDINIITGSDYLDVKEYKK